MKLGRGEIPSQCRYALTELKFEDERLNDLRICTKIHVDLRVVCAIGVDLLKCPAAKDHNASDSC
jgi:hypothetical protein